MSDRKVLVGLYARVSTKDKDQNPENQLRKLRDYCISRGWEWKEYKDYASGAKKERPDLNRLMNDIDNLDGVLVLRLDRFGRSLQNLLDYLKVIRSKGKFFEAIDQGLKISEKKDPMNDFMFAILGAAAEFERELISERVRDGISRARSEGKKLGRPAIVEKRKIDPSEILRLREEGKSIREISQILGIKRSTLHGILKSLSEKPTPEN